MKYWAFHCNPKAWDSIKEISEHDDGTWLINKQDEKDIQIGDKFALWVSGKDAGVYAFGEIIDSPKMLKEDEERASKYAINKTKFDNESLRVKLKYIDKFQTTPIIRNVILNSIWLNEDSLQHSFFNRPQGITSRELTENIFKRLLTLRQQANKIHEFREYLYGTHKNKSTSEDYLKMVPKIEKWFIENEICEDSFSFWESNSNINEINKTLNNSQAWKDLNKEESNWYSSPWNKWVDFNSKQKKQYWLYAPGENARNWEEFYKNGIMALGWDEIGNLSQYTSRNQIKKALVDAYGGDGSKKNDVSANDDFLNKINIGDIIIAKKGRGELLGYGVVTSNYEFDNNRTEYKNVRQVDWQLKGNWKVDFSLVLKTLTDITKYSSDHPDYNTYYERLLGIMDQNKKNEKLEDMNFPLNTILYGPPGTGKTYNTILRAAQIIKKRVIDSYDEALEVFKANLHDKIEFITFHQNYSYEDFIQGLRPDTENDNQLTFERKDGVFKEIADKALKNLIESEKPQLSKKPFEEVFNQYINQLVEGEIEEIEVKMKKVSFFITAISNKSIDFRKASGGTAHTLSIGTLKKMYLSESVLEIQGLASYYTPLLTELLKLGKDSSGKKEQIERQNYVIIIDEINRANISRVFGELITLIEPDKRSHGTIPLEARLPSGDPFIVPSNLFIIGTMNTADKSIALLDIALRRRFDFESMYPKYEIKNQEIYDVEILKKINKQIIKSKGHDFQIGHAYFMGDNKDLVQRMNKKVIPLLLEYYMNDEKEVKGILNSAGLIIEENSWPLKISGKND